MITTLTKGGNAPLTSGTCRVSLTSSVGIDVSAVLLGPDGKVRSDDDLVFYNHRCQDSVAVKGQAVVANLATVPSAVERIAIVASIDPELPVTHFDAGNTPQVVIHCEGARISFVPPPLKNSETVAVLVELYRRGGGWKARAVGQGWDTGLAGLAADVGIVVDDPGPSQAPSPPAPVTPRPAVPLGKVALSKAGRATIDMRKDDPELVVTATLEWNGGSAARRKAGADLDLYALFVPRSHVTPQGKRPNKTDGVVYYRQLGSLSAAPYMALDGDSRVPGRETVTIRRPDLQGYVLLCAYSAVENGTGLFKSYGARAVITDGRGSTVTVPLFNNRNLSYWVAIALLDFTVPSGVQIRHVEKYSGNHVEARPTLYSSGNFRMSTGKVEFKTR
ncbi:TerD family protein [Streptomyces paromomycinus]|uniref:Transport-associated protein n=1 Tax=Streptomyces paromomycinus TaxID=92743 RepID=A0A401W271_STREY|nr:TerD family protein [Streptomyces paromomycinus]GCD43396.1 transport-associated protein [Streptomyces paromomycinus]